MLFPYIIVAFLIVGCAVGRPLQNLDLSEEVDPLSDLQMLVPIEVVKPPKRSKSSLFYQVETPGKLGLLADGPYSRIPSEDFLLDDVNHDGTPKETIKKDLGSANVGDLGNFLSNLLAKLQAPNFRGTTQDSPVQYSGQKDYGKLQWSRDSSFPLALMNNLQQSDQKRRPVLKEETAGVLGGGPANDDTVGELGLEKENTETQTAGGAEVAIVAERNPEEQASSCKWDSLLFGGQDLAGSLGHGLEGKGCHSHCVHIYVLGLGLAGHKSTGQLSPQKKIKAPQKEPNPLPESLSKFRPIGGRRGWMRLDEADPKLRWYVNSRKPWKTL